MASDEKQEKLEDFSWDNWDAQSDLDVDIAVPEEVEVKPAKGEVSKKETKEVIEEEVVEAVDDISFDEEEFDIESDEEPDAKEGTQTLSQLKKSGIFSVLDDEDFEDLSDEDIPDVIDKEVNARIEEHFESFFEELDDDAIAFLKFKKSGGSTKAFVEAYGKTTSTPQGDIDDESYQEKIVKHGMSLEGKDADEIEDQIEWLKEGSKLKRYASKYEAKIDASNQKAREEMLVSQKKQDKLAQEQRESLSQDLKKRLNEADTIGHFSFSKQDKRELHGYMTKPKVRIGKDNYLTQMQADLQSTFQDPEKILVIAKLLKSNFDVSDIARAVETKVTKKTKDKLERKSTTMKSSKSSSGGKKKALFEYFDD